MHWMHLNLILMFCIFFLRSPTFFSQNQLHTVVFEIQLHIFYGIWLMGAHTRARVVYPHKKEKKPLIIKSDRNSHESREWFEYKLGMALEIEKCIRVFVFYLFWNAWCHLKSWYHAQAMDIYGAGIILSGLWEFFFFFRYFFFNFLLMLFCVITVCVSAVHKSIKAWNLTSTLFFISKHLSFIRVLHIRPLHLCVCWQYKIIVSSPSRFLPLSPSIHHFLSD